MSLLPSPNVADWDSIADTYHDEVIGPFHPVGGRTALHDIIDVLLPGAVVLDAGCGIGNLGRYSTARHLNTTVHGVDLSQRMLDAAKGGGYASLTRSDIRKVPFASETFDIVVAVNSVMPDPIPGDSRLHVRETFAEFSRVCKTGGMVVCVLPSYDSLVEEEAAASISDRTPGRLLSDPHQRVGDTGFGVARCMHDAVTITRELEEHNFDVVKLTPLQYSMLLAKLHDLRVRAWDWFVVAQKRG